MDCKVKKAFYDKYTGKYHGVGTSYSCTEERFEEIQGQGDFLIIEEEKPEKKRLKK